MSEEKEETYYTSAAAAQSIKNAITITCPPPIPISFPTSMEDLKKAMLAGEQSLGVNYFMHGEQVADKFSELMELANLGLAQEKFKSLAGKNWRLPKWFVQNQNWIFSQLQPKFDSYRTYQTWHDCGKPLVKRLDSNQQAHYPNHDEISAEAWLAAGGDIYVASLIENDMVCHHLRTVEETTMLTSTNPDLLLLMVTTLCEMHVCQPSLKEGEVCPTDLTSTAGFKMKLKRIAYNGKVMMRILLHNANSVDSEKSDTEI